jgi:CubicO group peptidase (beta-lactamase class C family)
LKKETWQKWLVPAVMVPLREIVRLESEPGATEPCIGWGLGWGLETVAGTFFQWGKMNGSRAFVMGSPARKAGVVLLTNSNTGLRLIHEVIASVLPGEHPAARWLAEGVSE